MPRNFTMPIANCVITPECLQDSESLIELWSSESGISAEHMTINLISSSKQIGKNYKIMASLALPSIWSLADISSLQLGLAKALSVNFSVAVSEVHVITTIVSSGMVVESGKEITW